jgi:DNA invertase Pin-like site-specific DNA recombinase
MNFGYARVSTVDQDPQLQLDALRDAGCDPIHVDYASGAKQARVELDRTLGMVRSGDTFTVWRLDRMARSVQHAVQILDRLRAVDARFVSLREGMDTSSAMGRAVFHIAATFAELQREIIRENTMAGLAAARANGRMGGRRPVLSKTQRAEVLRMLADGMSVRHVAAVFDVHHRTISRVLDAAGGRVEIERRRSLI